MLDSRDHERTGTEDNDELLGHHGDDKVVGLDGKDVLWGDWELAGNGTKQSDVLRGGNGNDFLYPSHGKNLMYGGPGNDRIIAYYGHGLIDCGPGTGDYAQTRWQTQRLQGPQLRARPALLRVRLKAQRRLQEARRERARRAQPSALPERPC